MTEQAQPMRMPGPGRIFSLPWRSKRFYPATQALRRSMRIGKRRQLVRKSSRLSTESGSFSFHFVVHERSSGAELLPSGKAPAKRKVATLPRLCVVNAASLRRIVVKDAGPIFALRQGKASPIGRKNRIFVKKTRNLHSKEISNGVDFLFGKPHRAFPATASPASRAMKVIQWHQGLSPFIPVFPVRRFAPHGRFFKSTTCLLYAVDAVLSRNAPEA